MIQSGGRPAHRSSSQVSCKVQKILVTLSHSKPEKQAVSSPVQMQTAAGQTARHCRRMTNVSFVHCFQTSRHDLILNYLYTGEIEDYREDLRKFRLTNRFLMWIEGPTSTHLKSTPPSHCGAEKNQPKSPRKHYVTSQLLPSQITCFWNAREAQQCQQCNQHHQRFPPTEAFMFQHSHSPFPLRQKLDFSKSRYSFV